MNEWMQACNEWMNESREKDMWLAECPNEWINECHVRHGKTNNIDMKHREKKKILCFWISADQASEPEAAVLRVLIIKWISSDKYREPVWTQFAFGKKLHQNRKNKSINKAQSSLNGQTQIKFSY